MRSSAKLEVGIAGWEWKIRGWGMLNATNLLRGRNGVEKLSIAILKDEIHNKKPPSKPAFGDPQKIKELYSTCQN